MRTRGTEVSKEKGVPKHSQIHKNPDRNPKNIYQLKKSVKKVKSVSSVKSVFKFLSTPKAYGHYIITDIIFRVAVVSLAFGRATNQKMKHG